eukprot:TRINITY_DN3869_c1_g2_i2.p3 TRINITY_DN3869_c1_g2~~TRINITY_DN3869_c1_g2_i2.p3  ORF type:complete len:236 (-),score=55.93 TRINITY_DN3869_c1_g2_i2:36-743(-)
MSAVKRSELQQTRRLEEAKRAAQILEEEWPDFETLKQQTYQQKEKLTPIPERVWALCNVGRQLSQGGGGEIERARRFLEEAVELQKTYVGDENHPGMLFVYETLCNLLENVPDWEQNAKEIRIQMFEILVKISERYREQSDFLSSVILMQDILQDYEIYIGQYYPPFQKVVQQMNNLRVTLNEEERSKVLEARKRKQPFCYQMGQRFMEKPLIQQNEQINDIAKWNNNEKLSPWP